MNDNISDLYADYLLSSFGLTTATGLSAVSEGQISHDRITRMLSEKPKNSAELRRIVKPLIRQIEAPDGVLITDAQHIGKALYSSPYAVILSVCACITLRNVRIPGCIRLFHTEAGITPRYLCRFGGSYGNQGL